MQIVSFLNQKGGVGKTSTAFHLAGVLGKLGYRVLAVDNDPQCSLSKGIWGQDFAENFDPSQTMAAVYQGDSPFLSSIVHPTGFAGFDAIPGAKSGHRFNATVGEESSRDVRFCLADLFAGHDAHDFILIDCPPNLYGCSWAALVCSDSLIIPVQAENYGAQGIPDVLESMELVRARDNPRLDALGIVVTMFNKRLAMARLFDETLRDYYGALVFNTQIVLAADFAEAVFNNRPITEYKPKGTACKTMRVFADEFLARTGIVTAKEAA
jgi:chromosome partitioning protein